MRHYSTTYLAFAGLALLVLLAGCDVFGSDDPDTFTATGTIINSTDRGVQDATVTFSQGEDEVQSVTTDDEGTFEAGGLESGDYTVRITASGYDEKTLEVSITDNRDLGNELLTGSANVQGTVVDAQTGETIEDAEVAFSFEADTSRTLADLITTTDSTGTYSISNAPVGTFLCVIRAEGFFAQIVEDVEFDEGDNALGQSAPSRELEDGQLRIVLSWGEEPYDLDSHLTGPDEGGDRFHVYYSNKNPSGAGANLDVDDTFSYGPETTTITAYRDGLYRYSVHNYSNQSDDGALGIESSPARIEVYDENGAVATYSPPSANEGDGNTWRVFEIEVANGTPSIDDNGGDTFGYYDASNSGDVTTFEMDKDGAMPQPMMRSMQRTFDQPAPAPSRR